MFTLRSPFVVAFILLMVTGCPERAGQAPAQSAVKPHRDGEGATDGSDRASADNSDGLDPADPAASVAAPTPNATE